MPRGLKKLEAYTFRDCVSLTDVSLPSGLTEIGRFSFRRCLSLTSIDIPSSVTVIWTGAFSDCEGLKEQLLRRILAHFDGYGACSLIVPIGTGDAYRQNPYFAQFKEIIPSPK